MSFREEFSTVQCFFNNSLVVSGEYVPQIAKLLFEKELGYSIELKDISIDRVKFGFLSNDEEGMEEIKDPVWYYGAIGKGSKEVYVYER